MTKRLPERDREHDGAVAFTVTKAVDLESLAEQIKIAHGWRKDLGLVAEGDPAAASPEKPVVLWVLRSEASTDTVRRVVTAHEGTEAQVFEDDEVTALRAKVDAGQDLTASEIQTALRLILTRG